MTAIQQTFEPAAASSAAATPSRTRFAGWSPLAARLMLAAFALLLLVGILNPPAPSDDPTYGGAETSAVSKKPTDIDLYKAIAARMAGGQNYYVAAAAEHRTRGYPLRPFVTVRLPTLATLEAHTGPTTARILLLALGLAAVGAFAIRSRTALGGGAAPLAVMVTAEIGLVALFAEDLHWMHEVWAGVFILLALGLRAPGRYAAAVVAGLLAVAVRELALPFLAVMAIMAWWEGERREAAAWCGAIILAGLGFVAHDLAVASVVTAVDRASPGWAAMGGWPFVIAMVQRCTICACLPGTAALLLPLCLLGWAAWPGAVGQRGLFLVVGYLAGFTVVGRSDNLYWMFLTAPLLFAGLGIAPFGLIDLVKAAWPRTGWLQARAV